MKKLVAGCVGAPDEAIEERELRIAELEERVEQLEQENFKVKQEMQQSKTKGFGKTSSDIGGGPVRSKDETDKIIADLSK